MSKLQSLIQAMDTLTPDEMKQLYTYILERRHQIIASHDSTPSGAARRGDESGFEWSGDFWAHED